MVDLIAIDLNCDLGEYDFIKDSVNDQAIMQYISSCNVACGAHAGNSKVIDHTISMAMKQGVNVGAHPSFPDRTHFGRKIIQISETELRATIFDQVSQVKSSIESFGGHLSHVKPHGALYNLAAKDLSLSVLLATVIADIDDGLMFYGLAESEMAVAAEQVGLRFVAEGFADRAYTQNKQLVARTEPDAVITKTEEQLSRVLQMLNQQQVVCQTGELIDLSIETLCLHGDHSHSLQSAQMLHDGLLKAGISIKAPNNQLA